MIKKTIVSLTLVATMLMTFTACEPYEDYIKDFDYSAVYFGTQKPLRTLVARESGDKLDFKLGVVLAGLRENKSDQWVTFEIAPDLLTTVTGASAFTLLPTDWYTFSISENKIIIPKGKFLGDFTISIDKAKFAADPLSLTKKYALPIRILQTSADSVLRGDETILPKDYTVLVVRYISENSGTYYVRGEQIELDINNVEVAGSKKEYYHVDWIRNLTRGLTTLSLTQSEMTGMGNQTTDKMKINFAANNAITLSTSILPVTDLGCTYDQGVYRLKYRYVKVGKTYQVDEYLKQRNDPEKDLRFEEW